MAEMCLIVWKAKGKHYATLHQPGQAILGPGQEKVFSKEMDIEPGQLELLQGEARKEARERGISHVINLF